MPAFRYSALDRNGRSTSGVLDAETPRSAVERLLLSGLTPLSTQPIAHVSQRPWYAITLQRQRRPSPGEIASLFFELGTLLSAGLPLDRALDFIGAQSYRAALREAMASIRHEVREGSTLSHAIEKRGALFPQECASVVRAGEASGKLVAALEGLAHDLKRRAEFDDKLLSALVYPAIVLLLVISILIFVLMVVLPQVETMLRDFGGALPLSTRILITVGDILQVYWWVILAVIASGVHTARRLLARADRRRAFDAWLLRSRLTLNIPLRIAVGRLCALLSLQLENGVGLGRALEIAKSTVSNTCLRDALAQTHDAVRHGARFSARLAATNIFPSLVVRLVAVGEESGSLARLLGVAARIYQTEVERDLNRLMSVLVPAMTIILGAIVAMVVGSVLVGILSVNQAAL